MKQYAEMARRMSLLMSVFFVLLGSNVYGGLGSGVDIGPWAEDEIGERWVGRIKQKIKEPLMTLLASSEFTKKKELKLRVQDAQDALTRFSALVEEDMGDNAGKELEEEIAVEKKMLDETTEALAEAPATPVETPAAAPMPTPEPVVVPQTPPAPVATPTPPPAPVAPVPATPPPPPAPAAPVHPVTPPPPPPAPIPAPPAPTPIPAAPLPAPVHPVVTPAPTPAPVVPPPPHPVVVPAPTTPAPVPVPVPVPPAAPAAPHPVAVAPVTM